jgi:hypothetical protein
MTNMNATINIRYPEALELCDVQNGYGLLITAMFTNEMVIFPDFKGIAGSINRIKPADLFIKPAGFIYV